MNWAALFGLVVVLGGMAVFVFSLIKVASDADDYLYGDKQYEDNSKDS